MRTLCVLLTLLVPASALAAEDEVRTTIVLCKQIPAKRAKLLYKKVIGVGKKTKMIIDKRENSLVIKDYRSKLNRFKALIRILDIPGAATLKIYVRPVLHLKASVLAEKLLQVMKKVSRVTLRIVPDDRGKRLVVMTTWPAYRKLDILARRLDVAPRRRH